MAGLLDSFFNPATFGGQNAGLLDWLRQSQMQQQNYMPSAGFDQSNSMDNAPWPVGPVGAPSAAPAGPTAVGSYQMPRIGSVAQFTPPPEDPAALPVNAQPAQGRLPAATPQENGFFSFLNRVNDNFQNMGNGGSLIGAITGSSPTNQTMQYLVKNGIDPALARNIAGDPSLLRAVLPSLLGTGGQTDDIKEYQFAKREDPTLTFDKFMAKKRSVTGEHGLNIVYGTDDKGNTIALQPSKSGGLVQAAIPPGVKLSSGVDKIDGGDKWILYDKRTGTPVGTQPKNIEEKEAAEERGKARGQAEVALPNVIASAEQTLKTIQSVKNDPYRERGTGASSFFNAIPATGGYDFAQKVEQLKGKTFLEAFQQLKGGGAITEIEGKKAENAIARLSVGQSEGAFLEALNELEEVVRAGIDRAKARAGKGGQTSAPAAAAPATNLKAKYGLD